MTSRRGQVRNASSQTGPSLTLLHFLIIFLFITSNMSDNAENDDDPVYNNSHRAFLQSFLSRATLTFEQARPIVAAIEKAQGRQPSF